MIDALTILLLVGITIVLGYIGSIIFTKTSIPDIVWLMLFGFIVSSSGLVDRTIFLFASPLLAAFAILIILFDAGLNMDIYSMIKGFPRSSFLAFLSFTLSMIATAITSVYALGFSMINGLLLGAIIGGTSTPIVVTLVSKLNVSANTKMFLSLESIITDPLCIVVSITLINIILEASTSSVHHQILSAFSIGAVIGLLLGLVWLLVLDKIRGHQFNHMLTLALVFLIYAFVEYSNGSGAIAALFFGLSLGNGSSLSRMLKLNKNYAVDFMMKPFQAEISFFIRSFFFVYLGLIVIINQTYIIYGILISAILILIRLIAVQISTLKMKIEKKEMNMLRIMLPRGLAAAVLAQLPLSYNLPGAEAFSNIAFVVIVVTVIFTSLMTFINNRKKYVKSSDIESVK